MEWWSQAKWKGDFFGDAGHGEDELVVLLGSAMDKLLDFRLTTPTEAGKA